MYLTLKKRNKFPHNLNTLHFEILKKGKETFIVFYRDTLSGYFLRLSFNDNRTMDVLKVNIVTNVLKYCGSLGYKITIGGGGCFLYQGENINERLL